MTNVLPSPREQEWLLESLSRLVARQGHEHFLRAPLLTPGPRCFPDPWAPDETGARLMIQRLLGYVGLDGYPLKVESYGLHQQPRLASDDEASAPHGRVVAAWFGGLHQGWLRFGVELGRLGDPDSLAGILGHEVAHAYRHYHRLVEGHQELEECLTDLTTIYLGFGILSVNVSYQYRGSGESATHSVGGYLSPASMSFLLATQAVLRGLRPRAFADRLEPYQAECFDAAFRELSKDRPGLARRIGVPDALLPEAGKADVMPPLFNTGKSVSRVERDWMLQAGAMGLSLALGFGPALWRLSWPLGAAAFAAAPVLALLGRRVHRDLCSDPLCRAPLRRDATTCGACGGRVVPLETLRRFDERSPAPSNPDSAQTRRTG